MPPRGNQEGRNFDLEPQRRHLLATFMAISYEQPIKNSYIQTLLQFY